MEHQFLVSARKYRPDTFDSVVGQPTITRTLKNAIHNKQLAHAYLFCGPRGVGKTTCARIFAKTINCTQPGENMEACGLCESCKTFQEQRSFNIHELDAASNNSVDDIRNLIEQVRIPPQVARYSVYIIDEVHMLSQQAFNAFLKTLEEPPAHAIFILATTEKHKIIPTILSRCQIYDFHRIQVRDMMEQLASISKQEGVSAEPAALNIIAQKADGSMRDALSIYDQVVSFCGNQVTYQQVIDHLNVLDYDYYFRLTKAFIEGNYQDALLTYDQILKQGFDHGNFVSGLASHFRDLLVSKDSVTADLFEMSGEIAQKYLEISKECEAIWIIEVLKLTSQAEINLRQSREPRLSVEVALIQLSSLSGNINTLASSPATPVVKTQIGGVKETVKQEEPKVVPELKPSRQENILKEEATEFGETSSSGGSRPFRVSDTGQPGGLRISDFMSRKDGNAPSDHAATMPEVPTETVSKTDEKVSKPEELTQDLLQIYWLEFSELQKDQTRLYNMLTTQLPVLADSGNIRMELNNPLQEKALRSVYHEILNYLMKRSGLDDLKLEVNIPQLQSQPRLYTQEDKLNHMRQKNPDLDLFRQTLNLDLE